MKGNWGPHPYAWAGKIPTEIPEWLARCAPDGRLKSAEIADLLGVSATVLDSRVRRGHGPEMPPPQLQKSHSRVHRFWIVRDVRNWIRNNAREAKALESLKS